MTTNPQQADLSSAAEYAAAYSESAAAYSAGDGALTLPPFPPVTVATRRCATCGEGKNLEGEFHRDSSAPGGRARSCKPCSQARWRRWRAAKENDPAYLERRAKNVALNAAERAAGRPPKRTKDRLAMTAEERRQRNAARAVAQRTVKCPSGWQRHHHDYSPEFAADVILIPLRDHLRLHAHLVHDGLRFRTLEGRLLDSREAHLDYAREVLGRDDLD